MSLLTDTLYHIPPAAKTRDRPMQVLCLGHSRSGTESLRNALLDLGYNDTSHGYTISSNLSELRSVSDMMAQKFAGKLKFKSGPELRMQFDKWLGDCMAVTDAPAAILAVELLAAYPEAKVVLNRRDDVDTWVESMLKTIIPTERNTTTRFLSWFERELFWLQRTWTQEFHTFFHGNFQRHGEQIYREHYRLLEQQLQSHGREYLEWKVEDGWQPLCQFLGTGAPRKPFPSGNASVDFMKRFGDRHKQRLRRARRNAILVIGSSVSSVLALYFGKVFLL